MPRSYQTSSAAAPDSDSAPEFDSCGRSTSSAPDASLPSSRQLRSMDRLQLRSVGAAFGRDHPEAGINGNSSNAAIIAAVEAHQTRRPGAVNATANAPRPQLRTDDEYDNMSRAQLRALGAQMRQEGVANINGSSSNADIIAAARSHFAKSAERNASTASGHSSSSTLRGGHDGLTNVCRDGTHRELVSNNLSIFRGFTQFKVADAMLNGADVCSYLKLAFACLI